MTQYREPEAGFLNHIRRRFAKFAALGGGGGLLAAMALIPRAPTGAPCCSVLAVDAATGVVTAFERKTGNRFSFSVKDKALLSGVKPCQAFDAKVEGLKQGQSFAADFGAGNSAKVNPATPCCEMADAPGTAGRVLGVQPHAKFENVEILLTDLKRTSGELVTANCLYCNHSDVQVDLASDMRARSDGAKLLDTENQVEYRVEQPGGEPLVSDHGPGLKLKPHQKVTTWMKFTAPQGQSVSLIVPGASEPFENLAIAK